jgi:hypothetical protein
MAEPRRIAVPENYRREGLFAGMDTLAAQKDTTKGRYPMIYVISHNVIKEMELAFPRNLSLVRKSALYYANTT